MAYKILKGTLVPGEVPPILEEEPELPVIVDRFPHHTRSNVVALPSLPFRPKLNLETMQFETEEVVAGKIGVGDHVMRRIRRGHLGRVEFMYFNVDGSLKDLWIVFGNKVSSPYQPSELLKVKTH